MKRERVSFTLDTDVIKDLRDTSIKTMIPQARIVEVAVREKLEKLKKGEVLTSEYRQ